jgi:hypothetical protein
MSDLQSEHTPFTSITFDCVKSTPNTPQSDTLFGPVDLLIGVNLVGFPAQRNCDPAVHRLSQKCTERYFNGTNQYYQKRSAW